MKIRIKRRVNEVSTVGAVQGYAMPRKRKKDNSEVLDEMFSSSTQTGGVRISITSAEKEHAGHVERSKHQGLRNVMEVEDTLPLDNIEDSGFFSDSETPMITPRGEDEERATQAQIVYPPIYDEALEHGYRLQDTLGKGVFGAVFSAEDVETGNDVVVKVVGLGEKPLGNEQRAQEAINRELSNYATISKAAASDERMSNHFPETYETWKATIKGDDFTDELGFIAMEKLVPLTDEESAFIPDLNYVIAKKKPLDAADPEDYGRGRDQSKRAKWFIDNKLQDLDGQIRTALEDVANDWDLLSRGNKEVDELAAGVSSRMLKRYSRMVENSPEKVEALIRKRKDFVGENSGYDMINYLYILSDEVPNARHAVLILLDLMTTLVKIGKLSVPMRKTNLKSDFDREVESYNKAIKKAEDEGRDDTVEFYKDELKDLYTYNKDEDRERMAKNDIRRDVKRSIQRVATAFINGIRGSTGIPISFTGKNIDQGEKERVKEMGPGRDLYQAIQLLYKKTGLITKDVHDKNVMKRDPGGDIVIVDLGLFKPDPGWSPESKKVNESRRYRLKILTNRRK